MPKLYQLLAQFRNLQIRVYSSRLANPSFWCVPQHRIKMMVTCSFDLTASFTSFFISSNFTKAPHVMTRKISSEPLSAEKRIQPVHQELPTLAYFTCVQDVKTAIFLPDRSPTIGYLHLFYSADFAKAREKQTKPISRQTARKYPRVTFYYFVQSDNMSTSN